MNETELVRELTQRHPLLSWGVTPNAKRAPGTPDDFEAEWWEIRATIFLSVGTLTGRVTQTREWCIKKGSVVIIGQQMSRAIADEILYYDRATREEC